MFTVLVHLGGSASVQIRASISSCAAVPRVWLLQAVSEATTQPRRALLAPLFFLSFLSLLSLRLLDSRRCWQARWPAQSGRLPSFTVTLANTLDSEVFLRTTLFAK